MVHLEVFRHHVFISYAHVDNLTAEEEPGWVDSFHRHLDVALSQRAGRVGAVRTWRDPKLQGNQVFNETIREAIGSSALFLALDSTGYCASTYCRQEIDWFSNHAGPKVGDRSRFLHVLLNNIPEGDWPVEFRGAAGFAFHDAEREGEDGVPVDLEDSKFKRGIRELAKAIINTLDILGAASATRAAVEGSEEQSIAPAQGTVYLATVSDGLKLTRKQIAGQLEQRGIKVSAMIPPPFPAAEHSEAVLNELKGADLSVHLLDEFSGADVQDEESTTYIHKQVDLALSHGRSQFFWVPRRVVVPEIEDPRQKSLLERLRDHPADSCDFVVGKSTTLADEIEEKLTRLRSEGESATPAAVLLDTHVKDQLIALDASRALLSKNIQPYVNPQEDDPEKNIELVLQRLKQVGALVVVFGKVHIEWVRARLAENVKLMISENCPVKSVFIYLAPPDQGKVDCDFGRQWVRYEILDNRTGFDPEGLTPLVRSLEAA